MALISINPATLAKLQELPDDSDDVVQAKIAAAQSAFESWKSTSFSERVELFNKVAAELRGNSEAYAKVITQEMGKPIKQSRNEVEKCATAFEYYAFNGKNFLQPETVDTEAKETYVQFDPLGIILAIMPWNFPFWQALRFASATIFAGNTVLLKHSSNVQMCAAAIQQVFEKSGFPAGVFTTLHVSSDKIEAIIADDRIQGVTLTGSEATGKKVAALVGAQAKKSIMELGGSDPFIILADADLPKAAAACAESRLRNTGQVCTCAKRMIVEKSIAAEFLTQYQQLFAAAKIGDPMDEATEIGPLSSESALTDIERQVNDSVQMGAKVLIGGKRWNNEQLTGYFYEPTILTDVTPEMPVFKEEVFGPVAPVFVVENAEEAIKLANQTRYGLAANIWTSDLTKAKQYITQLAAGTVYVNGKATSDPRLPTGGIKMSGYGRELSHFGLKEFVNVKAVSIN